MPTAADAFARLVEIVATLRGPEGCPWDREQTIETLTPFVLEETYEVVKAIDRLDHADLREELGDFVFEAVLLAQLESESGHFTIADSLTDVCDKLVRRHPHVFARDETGNALDSVDQVRTRWEEIKAQERAGKSAGKPATPGSLLSGIAQALPALLRAFHIGTRAASVGFDWTHPGRVVDKIQEEVDELREVVEAAGVTTPLLDRDRAEDEMGDLLFTIANLSRQLGIEPETALRKANDKFTRRFETMERRLAATSRAMRDMTLEELEEQWQRAKAEDPTT